MQVSSKLNNKIFQYLQLLILICFISENIYLLILFFSSEQIKPDTEAYYYTEHFDRALR